MQHSGTVNTGGGGGGGGEAPNPSPSPTSNNSGPGGNGGSGIVMIRYRFAIIMTSKIKVDNINKVSDDSNIIKKCGTTTTIGSGASNPIVVDGSAVTLGRCDSTVALASGASHRQDSVEQEL